jgi:hypothetical protein
LRSVQGSIYDIERFTEQLPLCIANVILILLCGYEGGSFGEIYMGVGPNLEKVRLLFVLLLLQHGLAVSILHCTAWRLSHLILSFTPIVGE